MISITIEQQNFEIKDLFVLEEIIQAYPASAQQILNETFSKPSECGYLISDRHNNNLEHLQSFVPDFMPTLYNIIVNTDDLLALYAKSTIKLQRFVNFFENKKDDIYHHLAIRSNLLSKFLEKSALLWHKIEGVNAIFPDKCQTTLDILLKDKNFFCLKHLPLINKHFPEQEKYLYNLFLNSANSLGKFTKTDDDYELVLGSFPKHMLLLSYCYSITTSVIQSKMNIIFEIIQTFKFLGPEQDYFTMAKLLYEFIDNTINELGDDVDSKTAKEILTFLQKTIKNYTRKNSLTYLCIQSMQSSNLFEWNIQNEKYNLSSLPMDLQTKYDPDYVKAKELKNKPEQPKYTGFSAAKNS